MPQPSADGDSGTPVTIYGRTYTLRGSGDRAYLEELAGIVDGKMREVADASGTADTLKLAILASLNLADESVKARRSGALSDQDGATEDRLAAMVSLLDEALEGQEDRTRRADGA